MLLEDGDDSCDPSWQDEDGNDGRRTYHMDLVSLEPDAYEVALAWARIMPTRHA